MKKIILFIILYATLLSIAFWQHERLLNWINETDYNQLPLMFLLSVILSLIPIIPFTVFAGIMGAKYGILIGALINWVGSFGAAITFFIVVRYIFFEQFQQYIYRFDKVKKFDELIGRNGLIAVLFIRMLPIIPTLIINIYSGISSILFRHYVIGTAIGKIPSMIILAYLGNQFFTSIPSTVFGALLYGIFLLMVFSSYYWWYKTSTVKS